MNNSMSAQPANCKKNQFGDTAKNNMKSDQYPKYNGKQPSYFFVTVTKLNHFISKLTYACGRISNSENVLARYIVAAVEANLMAITKHVSRRIKNNSSNNAYNSICQLLMQNLDYIRFKSILCVK